MRSLSEGRPALDGTHKTPLVLFPFIKLLSFHRFSRIPKQLNTERILEKKAPQILTIQIPLATLCNPPPSLLLVLLQHANLLQGLHHFPVHTSTCVYVVTGSRSAVLGAAVDFA